jgi:hypothetical protein
MDIILVIPIFLIVIMVISILIRCDREGWNWGQVKAWFRALFDSVNDALAISGLIALAIYMLCIPIALTMAVLAFVQPEYSRWWIGVALACLVIRIAIWSVEKVAKTIVFRRLRKEAAAAEAKAQAAAARLPRRSRYKLSALCPVSMVAQPRGKRAPDPDAMHRIPARGPWKINRVPMIARGGGAIICRIRRRYPELEQIPFILTCIRRR